MRRPSLSAPSRDDDVRLDSERLIDEVTTCLTTATTAAEACQLAVAAIERHTPAMVAVLLHVHDRLRCVAATGSWLVFSSVPTGHGVAGRAYRSGKTETVTAVEGDPDYIPLGPPVAVEICAPIPDGMGLSSGVLNLEWTDSVDLERWRDTAESIAARLGQRIHQLGGPPAESRSEKLLRHALTLTEAGSEWDLMAAAIDAARDVSGLAASVLVLAGPEGLHVSMPTVVPGRLESSIRARLATATQAELHRLVGRARRQGAAYTLGEPAAPGMDGYETLVEAGTRTLITVPVGPPETGGVLLVADEAVFRPDPESVNLMEMLAAQAWTCLDRLRSLKMLHERAISDPLTGLRHHGPFGERIAAATPGRTALLAVDVDEFKSINDTYGHQAGDRVLVNLARALQAALRQGDELFRVGGDEFVAVVEVQRAEEAVGIAHRLTEAARRIGRTVSIGVAMQRPGEPPEFTLRRADAALYDAKRKGRDGVRVADAA